MACLRLPEVVVTETELKSILLYLSLLQAGAEAKKIDGSVA